MAAAVPYVKAPAQDFEVACDASTAPGTAQRPGSSHVEGHVIVKNGNETVMTDHAEREKA